MAVPLTTLSFKNESPDTLVDILSVVINNVSFPQISNIGSGQIKTSQATGTTNVTQDLVLTIMTTLAVNTATVVNGSTIITGSVSAISGGYTITFAGFNFGLNSQITIN